MLSKKVCAQIFVIFSLLFILGCDGFPRGESKSLDQVVSIAKERYADANKAGVPADLRGSLDQVEKSLANLLVETDPAAVANDTKVIAKELDTLVAKAGYTSRPTITELMFQFTAFSDKAKSSAKINQAALRLLVSRTFTTLAVELETKSFKV